MLSIVGKGERFEVGVWVGEDEKHLLKHLWMVLED